MPLVDAIRHEKALLKPLKTLADLVVLTDGLSVHQLRNFVRVSFAPNGEYTMLVNLVSFGFKYGVPSESNFVYDLRSLPNPYFIRQLKPLNGRDQAVANYLFDQEQVTRYWQNLSTILVLKNMLKYVKSRMMQ